MLDLKDTALTAEERDILRHPQTGGVILFSRNYESPEQLKSLCGEIHALRDPRLIIAVDHEGGRVQRFRQGFTELPPMAVMGEIYDQRSHIEADRVASRMGWLMAAELLSCHVDISFAPVLDIAHGVSGVIGDRAFHRNPDIVSRLAQAFMRGMREAGMAATGKHFPGHGGVKEDSHITKPVDQRSLADLMLVDLVPFERLIQNGLAGIMPAHVVYSKVDAYPAGYSKFWLQEILRKQLRFQGVIFSDDLCMGGAEIGSTYADRAELALSAGCDMVLVCNHPEAAVEVLQSLEGYRSPASQIRLARMHGHAKHDWKQLAALKDWREGRELAEQLKREVGRDPTMEMNV
jgi:beta-N-acetylhexosaminidase